MPTRRRIFFCVPLLLLAIALALHLWLNSGPLRRAVLSEFARFYFGKVELDLVSLRVGGGVVLRGIRFHESTDEKSPVICEIPELDLDGSMWSMWRGHFQLSGISARKATLRVIQAADGSWAFRPAFRTPADKSSPWTIPLEISDAEVEFVARDRQGTKTIRRIDLKVTAPDSDGNMSIAGNVSDPVWGSWTVDGTIAFPSGDFRAHLACTGVRLTERLADWLGANQASWWRDGRIVGDVAIDATISGNVDGNAVAQYQVLLDPRDASVQLVSLQEPIHDLAGRIEITPDEVRVHGLTGEIGNGQIIAAGSLSRSEPSRLALSLELRRVELQRTVPTGSATDDLLAALAPQDCISGKFQAAGLRDPASWIGSFDGSLELHDSHGAHSVPLHLGLSNGFLELQDLQWQWSGGLLSVSARVPIRADGEIEGTVRLDHIDLRSAGRLAAQDLRELRGSADGELSFRVPLQLYADRHAWQWSGPVRMQKLQVAGLLFDSLQGTLKYRRDVLSLLDASAELLERSFSGSATLLLTEPRDLSVNFRMAPVDLAELESDRAARDVQTVLRGRLEASGNISGRLPEPIRLVGNGTVRRFGFSAIECDDIPFRYELVEKGFRFSGLDFPVFGGRFRGSGRWIWPSEPVAATSRLSQRVASEPMQTSEIRLLGSFENVELSQMLEACSVQTADVRGLASGQLQLQFDLLARDPLSSLRAAGRAESNRLLIAGIPIVDAAADFEYDGKTLTMPSLAGRLPAGAVTGSAKVELSQERPSLIAELQSSGLGLAAITDSMAHRTALRRFSGTTSGQVSLQFDLSSGELSGQGSGRIQSLAIGNLPIIDSVLVRQFEVRDGRFVAPSFQAALWGGAAAGSCELDLREDAARLAEMSLTQVDRLDLARMTALWPTDAGAPRGKMSGTGKLAVMGGDNLQTVVGVGNFSIESATFAGLALGRTVGTIEAFDAGTHEIVGGRIQAKRGTPSQRGGQRVLIKIREAQPARGSLQGTVLLGHTGVTTYDASLRFNGVDLATVAQALFASRHPVSGTLSGEMRLVGTERGADDARGEMWLRVDNGNLWRLPVLAVFVRESTRVFNRLLNLNVAEQGPQTALARRVTLENGVLHVHEFWIAGDMGRLFGEGKIALDGRIDLDFVGNFDTGLPKNVPLLGQLNGAINWLQQRLVKIHLSGTLSDPVAIPVPLQDLTEPAEKFFRGAVTGTLFDEPGRSPRPMLR